MKVLMFGWEFPPHLSGGLGTACYGITTALASRGTNVVFVLPRVKDNALKLSSHLRLRSASGITVDKMRRGVIRYGSGAWKEASDNLSYYLPWSREAIDAMWHDKLKVVPVKSTLTPYATMQSYRQRMKSLDELHSIDAGINQVDVERHWKIPNEGSLSEIEMQGNETINLHGGYGQDLMDEVYRYSHAALGSLDEDFDVIHVHDWMTYPAGILLKRVTGKPLIAHIHALERDRSGFNVNTQVSAIERAGMEAADVVVAVSHYTKERVHEIYGIPLEKIRVVHNAVTRKELLRKDDLPHVNEKRVLFMARITYQKGPEYFVEAARLVLDKFPNTRFIMAGSGDMMSRMVRRVAQLRIGSHFHFTGFLKGEEVDKMYAMSDLYVMPSVSEPFGIAPLEAMTYDTPVLISKQSGVSEVVKHALKVNFWDIRDMADKICAVLAYPKLADELSRVCREELKNISWERAADELNRIYASLAPKKSDISNKILQMTGANEGEAGMNGRRF